MKKYIDEEGHTVKVWKDGPKVWLKNGKRHRDGDKPAVVDTDGTKHWFKNGLLHRENNAAIIWKNGEKWYYLNGVMYTDIFLKENSKGNEYWVRLLLMEY